MRCPSWSCSIVWNTNLGTYLPIVPIFDRHRHNINIGLHHYRALNVIFQVKHLLSTHASTRAYLLQCLPIDLVTRLIPPCVFPTEPCIYPPFITSSRLTVKSVTDRLLRIKRLSHFQSLLSALFTLLNHSLSTPSSSPASTAPSNRSKPAMELIDTQPMNVSEQSSENPSQYVQIDTLGSNRPDSS